MAYTNGSSIKKVLIDGVLHPVNDYRIEGTNFAVTQIAGDIAVGTPLTAEQLTHITEPVMSADGCVINAPALGTILIPKNVVFNPAATDDYVISYVSSPLEGKTYNLKITMDHTTGLPKEAVFAEEEVAAPPTNILKTKLDTYKTEFAKPVAERDPAIVAEAKVFGNDVLSKKPNIIVELDADNQPVEVFHATESPDPTAYYRYVNGKNECIDIYYDGSTDPYTTTDLAFPDLENIYVEKAKEYMEIATTVNSVVYRTNKPVMLNEDTLGFTQVEQATQTQGTAGIIHYPKSVLFTSDNAFELKLASTSGAPTAKIEVSKDGLIWNTATWSGGVALKADTLNSELGKYSIFVKADDYLNDAGASRFCSFTPVSGSNIEVLGILDAMWGGKSISMGTAAYIFNGLTSLVSAKNLVLPKENAMGAYISAFSGCTNLKEGPTILPAPETGCYQEMFRLCTSLVKPPILTPAETMPEMAYMQMFEGCSSLVEAPILPATTLSESCYQSMLAGTAITYPPALPATTLALSCYAGMFASCESLITVPELPATELPSACYDAMFENCTGLTAPATFPILTSVATSDTGSFFKMFDGCTGIKWATSGTPYIIKTTDGSTTIAASTDMFKDNGGTTLPEGNGTPKLNTTYYFGSESNGLLFTSPNAFTVALVPDSPYTPNANFKISKDGETWEDTTWDENNGISLIADTLNPNLGEYSVYIKGDNHFNTNFDYNSNFLVKSGDNISVSGDLDELWGKLPITDCECAYMFVGMTQLINAENLRFPEETASSCYYSMFADCDNLVNPPALLPAKRIGSAAYYYMFNHCTSLTKAPVILGDTICTTDDRPEHVQGGQCYCMFTDTGITEIPTLLFNNFELNDMNNVDEGSTFGNMFSACPNLTNISGVLMPAQALPHSACDGMFEMCDNLVSVSSSLLPATTLGDQCYYEMFNGCTSLTNTPQLPATVLGSSCYERMFKGCIALTKPSILPTLTSIYYSMSEMYLGCSGIKWAASGTPYEIKVEGGSTDDAHTTDMFKNNTGALPEGTGTPKLNTVYYLAV